MPLQDIDTYHASAHLRRRGAIALVGGSAVAYTATYVAATFLPKQFNVSTVVLEDPQEPVPCGGLKPPNPPPQCGWDSVGAATDRGCHVGQRRGSAAAVGRPNARARQRWRGGAFGAASRATGNGDHQQ